MQTAKILGLTKEDVLLSWLPVEHTFGLIYFLLLPIYVGCRQVHMATSMFAENPLTWLEQINHYRATVTAGPNFAYQIVLNNMTENCHWDLSCLRYILNGGEPISKKNLHKFLDANKQYHLKENCLIPIYGMTETSGAVVLNVPYREPDIDTKQVDTGIDFDLKSIDILKNDLVCQGKTINGCSIRIVDDFNRDLGQMKVGNIQFKGEFLCKGYLNKDNKDLFADGWLCTGDIGFLSGQNLYIVGRKKDMFFMHGKNIYMRDIEQIIFERYGVRSAACGENNAMEEKSKIYLFMELEISSAEYTKKKKEIIMFIQGETGIKLSDVIFKDDMFMTQVGKFSKAELLKKYKKDMVEDLIKTIDMIDGKIILIAHSLGCRIAQMCLEEIYSSIQSVVLITPMPVRNNFLQLLQMSKKQRKNNLEYILFSERLDSERKEYYMSLLDKESKKVEYAMMKRQKKFSIYVRKIPTLVIGSYNDQCVILQAVKDNAKIHTAELKIVDSVCHDMMLDPDWRNIADLIFKFIEKTIDKKSGDNYNDNYVSTQAHQGGE